MGATSSVSAVPLPLYLLYPASYIFKLYKTVVPRPVSANPSLLTHGKLQHVPNQLFRVQEDKIHYCEDLVIWERHRVAILSTDPTRATYNPFTGKGNHEKAENGRIQLYNLDTEVVVDLEIRNWPKGRTLHTLGLSILEKAGGQEAILGIASWMQKSCCIEVVLLTAQVGSSSIVATHIGSLEHPGINSPNALVVLSESQVLFTNSFACSSRRSKVLNTAEQLFGLPGGSVCLLTQTKAGITCAKVISGIPLANGLAISADRTLLAVASSTGYFVAVYDVQGMSRNETMATTPKLSLRREIPVGMLADNLQFVKRSKEGGQKEEEEVLLCAGHPVAFDFLAMVDKPLGGLKAPSRVVKLSIPCLPSPASTWERVQNLFVRQGAEVDTVFESKGNFFATSSTAAAYETKEGKQAMLVCGLWENGLLCCEGVDI